MEELGILDWSRYLVFASLSDVLRRLSVEDALSRPSPTFFCNSRLGVCPLLSCLRGTLILFLGVFLRKNLEDTESWSF